MIYFGLHHKKCSGSFLLPICVERRAGSGPVENDVLGKAVKAVMAQLIDECSLFVCSFPFSKPFK